MHSNGLKRGNLDSALIGRRGRPSAAETRERMAAVLQAARAEFAEHGFHAATMGAIAVRAGVSKRTLYLWHEDKAALFHAVVIDSANHLALPPIEESVSLYEGLLKYATAARRELRSEYSFQVARLIMREGAKFPQIWSAAEEGTKYFRQPLELRLQQEGFDPSKAARLVQLFMGMLLSDIQQYAMSKERMPENDDEEEFVELVVRLFLAGISEERAEAGQKGTD